MGCVVRDGLVTLLAHSSHGLKTSTTHSVLPYLGRPVWVMALTGHRSRPQPDSVIRGARAFTPVVRQRPYLGKGIPMTGSGRATYRLSLALLGCAIAVQMLIACG